MDQVKLERVQFIISDPFAVLEHARQLAHSASEDDRADSGLFASIALMLDYVKETHTQMPEVLAMCMRVTSEIVLPNMKSSFVHGLEKVPEHLRPSAVAQAFLFTQSTAFLHVLCDMAVMTYHATNHATMIGIGSPGQFETVKENTVKMITDGTIQTAAWGDVISIVTEHPEMLEDGDLDTLVVELAAQERSV